MKDFDTPRKERQNSRSVEERTFQIGGETFVVTVGVHPDVLASYDDLNESDTATRTVEVVDEFIINMLEGNDAAERWHAIRANRADPIELDDLLDLSKWLLETATGRPTGQPGDSSPGPASTETASTADSSSPAVPTA